MMGTRWKSIPLIKNKTHIDIPDIEFLEAVVPLTGRYLLCMVQYRVVSTRMINSLRLDVGKPMFFEMPQEILLTNKVKKAFREMASKIAQEIGELDPLT